jgi:hypothetical protein
MISCLLSCDHQTYDRISVYPIYIISCLYPIIYHILSLSYPDHQTGPKCISVNQNSHFRQLYSKNVSYCTFIFFLSFLFIFMTIFNTNPDIFLSNQNPFPFFLIFYSSSSCILPSILSSNFTHRLNCFFLDSKQILVLKSILKS